MMKLICRNTGLIKRDQGGAIMLIFALLLVPMLGLVGLAVDTARAYAVKQRLQEAIDSASLVAAKNFSAPNRDQLIKDYFEANWRTGFMNTAMPTLTFSVNQAQRTVTVNAVAVMPTIFAKFINYPTVTVGTLTSAVSSLTYLEVALALDNTASMRNEVLPGVRRVDAMKTAAKNFIDTLFTVNGVPQDTIPNMWVSVIPFTSMVNVGAQHTNFLKANTLNGILWDYPRNSTAQNSWRGCVFERSFYENGAYAGRDLTDHSPAVEAFFPYHVVPAGLQAFSLCAAPPPCPPGQKKCSTAPNLGCVPQPFVCPPAPPSPPPAPPQPPQPPPPPPPVPPCTVDGFPCKVAPPSLKGVGLEAPSSNLHNVAACRSAPPAAGVATYIDSYAMSPISLVFQTPTGIKVYYPSPDGMTPMAFNKAFPGYDDMSVSGPRNVSGDSICCHGSNGGDRLQNIVSWTATGRWIEPWPTSGTPKIGGWGNSGCGLPLLPLQDNRIKIKAKIDEMDIPPLKFPALSAGHPSNRPDLGYVGTLINQGLIWAWRSLSPNWQGYWKEPSGTPLPNNLPLSYTTDGSSKAVVVMTDGLNFLEDPFARISQNGALYFGQLTLTLSAASPNLSPHNAVIDNNYLTDSSAYGTLGRDMTLAPGGQFRAYNFCRVRQMANLEPHLSPALWGCKEYDGMIRNAAGTVLRSGVGTWGPYDVTSALTGPYYTELQSRLLKTCQNMVDKGIRIYFILFDIDDNPQKASAMAAFNTCVSNLGGVYDASSPAQLNNAFQNIAISLRSLRLKQ